MLLAGREEAAVQAYHRALELDGSHASARFNLGLLEQQHGRHDEALKQFETLLELDPNNAWAHYQSGVSLQELDRRKDATEHYARAFGLDPTLSFAENNPHIIDNSLVTEALLLSTKYSTTASRTVARQYDDADRIRQPDAGGRDHHRRGHGRAGRERWRRRADPSSVPPARPALASTRSPYRSRGTKAKTAKKRSPSRTTG